MPTLEEMRADLKARRPTPQDLPDFLRDLLFFLYGEWDTLSPETQQRVDALRRELAQALATAPHALARGQAVLRFLDALWDLDELVARYYDMLISRLPASTETSRAVPTLAREDADVLVELAVADPTDFQVHMAMRAPVEEARAMEAPPEETAPETDELEEAASGVAKGVAAGEAARLHPNIDFPAAIPADTTLEHPLIVQLTQEQRESSRATGEVPVVFARPGEPEMVEVRLTAPDFVERTGIWSRTIAVYRETDSQPAIFLLRLKAGEAGPRRLAVDFYHRGRNVGTFVVETTVEAQTPPRRGTRTSMAAPADTTEAVASAPVVRGFEGLSLPAQPPPPADVELRVVRSRDGRTLHFTLHSPYARLGYHWREMGAVTLDALADPAAYFAGLVDRLDQLARQPVDNLPTDQATAIQEELKNLGWELYDSLCSAELKREIWRILDLAQQIREAEERPLSLLITSDEPWIPWELCYPVDEESGREADFLAGAFQLTRWLAGRGPMPELAIRAVGLVAPEMDLAFVAQEQAYFRELAARRIQVRAPLSRKAEILTLAREGGVQLIHVATHGSFVAQSVQESAIQLEDGPLTPRDLNPRTARGLLREHPLVFFNTCHSGRLGFTPTGLGGWAERLVDDVAVTAFIGSLWEISDELAPLFARTFYDALWDGRSLGEAFHAARLAVRQRQPANPTWLAYTLYGDPNARIQWSAA